MRKVLIILMRKVLIIIMGIYVLVVYLQELANKFNKFSMTMTLKVRQLDFTFSLAPTNLL
jgi:hypothetical protein